MRLASTTLVLFFVLMLAACGDDDSTGNNASNNTTNNANNSSNNATNNVANNTTNNGNNATNSATNNRSNNGSNNANNGGNNATNNGVVDLSPLGGDRPVEPEVPSDFDPNQEYPLIMLMHGYTASGALQTAYFKLLDVIDEKQFILLAPDGTRDSINNRFWNATDACCNAFDADVDDFTYVRDLIFEAKDRFNIADDRVYFIGHSNGGFMSHRMACDLAGEIAAIVSLAGATFKDETRCDPVRPVSILQIHGTLDPTIAYGGGAVAGQPEYPGAVETVETWADINGCTGSLDEIGDMNITALPGAESSRLSYGTCDADTTVELWRINGGGHIPTLEDQFPAFVIDWMYDQ